MKKYCYWNGKIVPVNKTQIMVNDLGVIRGYGVFDFLKTVNGGKPFLWREHWRRFNNSAKQIGLKVPVSEALVLPKIKELLKKNKCRDASLRLVLTGGSTTDGISVEKPNFFILAEEIYEFPEKVFAHGAKLITYEYLRTFPEAKTTNYIVAVKLQKEKKKRDAIEILYHYHGLVLETATSNFFMVKDGKLITSKSDILGGTVRGLVIKLAKKERIPVVEREIEVGELKGADEAFLTATNKQVTPIVQIDDFKIGSSRAKPRGKGKVGPITRRLLEKYREFVRQY